MVYKNISEMLRVQSDVVWDLRGKTSLVDRASLNETLRILDTRYSELRRNNKAIIIELSDGEFSNSDTSEYIGSSYYYNVKNCTNQYIINIKCDLASDEYNVSLIAALSIILANQVLDEAAIPYKSRTMIVELLETYYIDQLVYRHSRIMREQALASIALKIADEDTYYRDGLLTVLTMLDNLLIDKASYNADKYKEYNLYKKLCWFMDNINEPKNLKLELLNSLRFSIANISMTGE